jgi:succinoglycan biosynthesis transport protein ExoP
MNDDQELEEQSSGGFSLDAIYYVLFRRKWIILFFLVAALVGAALLLFVIKPPQYHSEAEIYIRYVVEARTPTVSAVETPTRMLNEQDDSIVNTEIDILRSLDVAKAVVRAVGAERILAKYGGGSSFDGATAVVRHNLTVEPLPRRSVLALLFRHPDPAVAQEVLRNVILAYSERHIELRQPLEMNSKFFTEETKRLRQELEQTEEQLKAARAEAGVASLEEARNSLTRQKADVQSQLTQAKAELAGYRAVLKGTVPPAPAGGAPTNQVAPIPRDRQNEYRTLCDRLDQLLKEKEAQLFVYTPESFFIRRIQERIDQTQAEKRKLEQAFPGLTNLVVTLPQPAGQPAGPIVDPVAAAAGLEAKIEFLDSQLTNIQAQITKVEEKEPRIRELVRQREELEGRLKRFSDTVAQVRLDAAVGDGKAPNIGIIQSPTPPKKMWSKDFLKKLGMITGGCASLGFLLAFALEFLFDRSVKRPVDLEKKLRLPLLITIPDMSRNGHREPARKRRRRSRDSDPRPGRAGGPETSGTVGLMAVALWERGHALRRYCEGLRDRLIVDFEVRNLVHKPKLVAVTSCNHGAGVSSIAVGLAAALSETGKGNVLLVDMNEEQGKAQQFHKGKAGRGADDRLGSELVKSAHTREARPDDAAPAENSRLPTVLPHGVANLMPELKASEYDYIVFDTPPVSQTSVTPRLAGLMDSVVLVVESEQTKQEAVQQASAMLAQSKAHVSTVLNKVRQYIPTRLYQEFLNDT